MAPDVWTEADLDSLPDDGNRFEILEGSLLATPPRGGRHQYIGDELRGRLSSAAPPGWRVVTAIGVRVPRGNLIPDIVVLRAGADLDLTWHDAADVALVVEIASPSTETIDRGSKALKYAEARIPSYWRVAVDGTLTVHELAADAGHAVVATAAPGDTWTATQPFDVTITPADLLD